MGISKDEAVAKLNAIKGMNLHTLAVQHGITIIAPNGKVNKGWAGQTLERHLGLQINSSRSPNLGSWELKAIPLKMLKSGKLQFKETMAVTMIDPPYVTQTPFEDSHLLTKLKRFVLVARFVGDSYSDPTHIHSVSAIKLDTRPDLYNAVKADYELVQKTIQTKGFDALSGKMGVYIQPRTKGQGGNAPKTRAFYARPKFLAEIMPLD